MKSYTLLALFAAAVSAQTTHTVTVGGVQPQATGDPKPVLGFSPESIQAAPNDVVEFHFFQKNHTVTQSTFAEPCGRKADGIDSGFMANPDGAAGVTFQMTVPDTTEALWFYCAQEGHCGKGMVFAVNAVETSDKSFTAYKQLAINQAGENLQPANIVAPNPTPAAPQPTVTINAGEGAPGAPGATVVPGQGQDANGQACSCSCLCGVNSFPQNAALGGFGGFAGSF